MSRSRAKVFSLTPLPLAAIRMTDCDAGQCRRHRPHELSRQKEPLNGRALPESRRSRFPIDLARGAPHLLAPLLLIALLTACSTVDRVDQTEFQPVGDNEFVFLARASIGYPPGADTAAESERLEWIGRDLARNGMCPLGWFLVERTELKRGREALLAYPVDVIEYRGQCATQPVGKAPAE